jgi:hypothetical protein
MKEFGTTEGSDATTYWSDFLASVGTRHMRGVSRNVARIVNV